MPTPRKGYYNAEGKRLPSVTTVIGKWKDSIEGLLGWANKCGMEGKHHRDVSGDAADSGTLTHLMVEKWIEKNWKKKS